VPGATVGDLDVAYDIAGPEGGTPILMINGLGADRSGWGLQVPAFSREFRTITYDNRDVGQTGAGRAPHRYGIRQFADDAVGLLDALGIARAHIVGASMGGAVAQEFGLAYPQRTECLTIVCSWANVDPWLAELLRHWETVFDASGALEWMRASWLWVFTWRFYDADPANLADLLATAAANPAPQTAAMYRRQSHAAAAHNALDRLGGITSPTHVIAGADDQLTPLRFSEAIAAAIPDARLSVMPDVGHGMFWEATEAFNDLVLGFIRDVG
jgi:3-oxoadipate enol-lactonase